MKILLVAPQSKDTILGVIGGYCKKALMTLGHEVQVFDFRSSPYLKSPLGAILKSGVRMVFPSLRKKITLVSSLETKKMNRLLLEEALEFKPDILFVLMGDTIAAETVRQIKESGIITANWFHDTVLASIRKEFVQEVSPYYDYFFMIDALEVLQYAKISSKYIKSAPLACDPQVHKSINLTQAEKKTYGSDICFVGTVKFHRQEVLARLSDFDLKIWGYWAQETPQLKHCYRKQHVYAEDMVKIYNAANIVLDIPIPYSDAGVPFYVTPRVFEVLACGAFLLTRETPFLSDLFEAGKEIICYRDETELKDLIRHYLLHPDERNLIAKRGQQRAYKDHTYVKRLSELLSFIRDTQEHKL